MRTLDDSNIRKLIYEQDSNLRDIGIQEMILGFPDTLLIAFKYLVDCDSTFLNPYKSNLRKYLPFLRQNFSPPLTSNKSNFLFFDNLRILMKKFLYVLEQFMKKLEEEKIEYFLKHMLSFPGIKNEFNNLVLKTWGQNRVTQLEQYYQEISSGPINRQFMIILSYACNLRCAYCFAKDITSNVLSLATAKEIIDWAQSNGANEITFLGGEPTVYPYFPEILDYLKARGLRTYFATNLLLGEGVSERLTPDVVDSLIVHVSHQSTYQKPQYEELKQNMGIVKSQNVPMSIRINMFRSDHNWSHIFELAEEFNIPEIQFAFAFPNSTCTNEFVSYNEIKILIPALLDLIDQVSANGLRFAFSKPIPLCFVPESKRMTFLYKWESITNCGVFSDGGTRNIIINPNLMVSPCLGLLNITQSFDKMENWEDLSAFCRPIVNDMLKAPLLTDCDDCFLYERQICQGACLAYKVHQYKKAAR